MATEQANGMVCIQFEVTKLSLIQCTTSNTIKSCRSFPMRSVGPLIDTSVHVRIGGQLFVDFPH